MQTPRRLSSERRNLPSLAPVLPLEPVLPLPLEPVLPYRIHLQVPPSPRAQYMNTSATAPGVTACT